MSPPSLIAADQAVFDIELLELLRGRRLSAEVRVLCIIGAHKLGELTLIDRIFPRLKRIHVFEPLPAALESLRTLAQGDKRITVIPVAVSESNGSADFHVSSNDGESSSLLNFGTHSDLFPEVQMRETIRVRTCRLESALREFDLEAPDAVIIDVQGAELQVLRSFGAAALEHVRLIYSEVSTESVYAGSGLLSDVEALLAPRFLNLGFAPLRRDVTVHGNAIFVARNDVRRALAFTWSARLRQRAHRIRDGLRRLRGRPITQ
jgi:FkbM family methyltransferase